MLLQRGEECHRVGNFAELSGERTAVDAVVEVLRGNLDKIPEHGKRADGIVKSMLEHSREVSANAAQSTSTTWSRRR